MAQEEKLATIDDGRTIDEQVPLTAEQRKRLEEYIEEEEGAHNVYKGALATISTPRSRSSPPTSCGRCTSPSRWR
jgi:hypothetical protein